MSERKGHGNRGSLMDLAKPRLTQSPLSTPIDEAERLILSQDQSMTATPPPTNELPSTEQPATLANPTDPPTIRSEMLVGHERRASDSENVLAKLRKNRQPIAVVGFKLPATLKDELSAVAQHNGTDMTRIVIEALERLLENLPHPQGWHR